MRRERAARSDGQSPSRRAGETCEKSRQSRREGFMYLTTTSRDGVTLLVAKQPFPSQSDTSRRFDGVTTLIVTKSLFSLQSNTSRHNVTLSVTQWLFPKVLSNPSRHKVTLRKGFKQHFSDHHPHQDKNGACNFVIYERRKL